MIYNTPWFLGFFAVFYALLWVVPGRQPRLWFLLAASALFHTHFAGPAGVLPILAMAVATYLIGPPLARAQGRAKRAWLLLGLAIPVAALVWYKYRGFFAASLADLLPGQSAGLLAWGHAVAMPLAISFFTFEFVHYLTEIYRGAEPSRSPLKFALFCIYFPSIVSGPIKRYSAFTAQMEGGLLHPWRNPLGAEGAAQVILGFFKKMVIADNAVTLIGALEARDQWSTGSSLLLIALQSVRILCDFSGYSDIAIGLAKLCGLQVPKNFNYPYVAENIQDFWRRWHMSLSSWIRDYIYIPLGGSRQGSLRKGINVIAAMGLCGLWHGPAWNFVLWGFYHGLGMALHGLWLGRFPLQGPAPVARRIFGWALTLAFVCYGWLLFFYPLPKALSITRGLFNL